MGADERVRDKVDGTRTMTKPSPGSPDVCGPVPELKADSKIVGSF